MRKDITQLPAPITIKL